MRSSRSTSCASPVCSPHSSAACCSCSLQTPPLPGTFTHVIQTQSFCCSFNEKSFAISPKLLKNGLVLSSEETGKVEMTASLIATIREPRDSASQAIVKNIDVSKIKQKVMRDEILDYLKVAAGFSCVNFLDAERSVH